MKLTETEIKKVIDFVKKEPRTVQEVSKLIDRSWITTESYLKEIKSKTGMIEIKAFRQGSKSGMKIVYYNYKESALTDQVKEELFGKIKNGRDKKDFDFMDIFQLIPKNKKRVSVYPLSDNKHLNGLINAIRKSEDHIYFFSGNLSFINIKIGNTKILDVLEDALKRKVYVKIICRVNVASLKNFNIIQKLLSSYGDLIEIRHNYCPLRGFVVDGKISQFKNVELVKNYKENELERDINIMYEIYDELWIDWLEKVFWNIFRTSLDYSDRMRELKEIV